MSIQEYQFGSTGEDVKRIQRALNEKSGSSLKIDGKYGVLTQAAVIKFQESREDLRVDGIVGAFTWNALGLNELAPPDLTFDSVEPPTVPPPVIETPEQTKQRRSKQREEERAYTLNVNSKDPREFNFDIDLPKDQQQSGQEKLNQLVLKKAINFVSANLGVLNNILRSLDLPNVQDLRELQSRGEETVQAFIEEQSCANQETLKEAVRVRNAVNQQLTQLGVYYNLTNTSINRLSDFLSGQISASKLLKTLRGVTSQASKIIPSPPGVPGIVTSTLSDVSAIVDLIVFSTLGEPKLVELKAVVDNGLMYIALSSQALKRLLEPLNILDRLLEKCGETVTPVSNDIKNLNQVYNPVAALGESDYQGFTLEIIEEPFSSTVTRRKAVAKNDQGIILVETPLSFTTLDQVLLDQVKFIIDSQNLKPN